MSLGQFTSVWDGAGDAAEQASADLSLAQAKAASEGFRPFLAAAQSEAEYGHREALVAERLTEAAMEAGLHPQVLATALKAEWEIVREAMTQQAARGDMVDRIDQFRSGHSKEPGTPEHEVYTRNRDIGYEMASSGSHTPEEINEHAAKHRYIGHPQGSKAERDSIGPNGRHEGHSAADGILDGASLGYGAGGYSTPAPRNMTSGPRVPYRASKAPLPFAPASRTRRLAIVHVAGPNPFADQDDDPSAEDMPDEGDADQAPDLAQSNPGAYYVLDEDAGADIGGPYASKADAKDAIDAGVFDADPATLTTEKGTVAENGGAPDPDEDGDDDADPAQDPDQDGGDPAPSDNPFAKKDALRAQANPYTDDNPFTSGDGGDTGMAGGAPQDDADPMGNSLTSKPRQMPSGQPPTPGMNGAPSEPNVPQPGADASGMASAVKPQGM